MRILGILDEQVASPLEISRMLRAPLGVVAYHVRTLEGLGLIEVVREVQVRGALQRFFRARSRPQPSTEDWSKAPPVTKQAVVGATLQQIDALAQASNATGGFDRADAHLTRMSLTLDGAGWARVAALLDSMLRSLDEIEREVAERGAGDPTPETSEAGLVMMLFERPRVPPTNEATSPTDGA